MKTLSCDICDKNISAETFEAWFNKMKDHYMLDHAEVMAHNASKSREEVMKWVTGLKRGFDAL
jgi:hypothetical protein